MSFWIWLILSNFSLIIFYVIYRYLLRDYILPAHNRITIVAMIVLAVLLPITSILIPSQNFASWSLPELTLYNVSKPLSGINEIQVFSWLFGLYIAGVFLSITLFSYSLIQIFKIIINGRKLKLEKYTVVENPLITEPFTFFKFIFVQNYETIDTSVIKHEESHAIGMHSMDIILIRLLSTLCWFNPIVYLWLRENRMQHEYIADDQAKQAEPNIHDYIIKLVHSTLEMEEVDLVHGLSSPSLLFQRIKRLQGEPRKRSSLIRLILILPLIAILSGFISMFPSNNVYSTVSVSQKKVDQIPSYVGGPFAMGNVIGTHLDMERISENVANGESAYVSMVIDEFGLLNDVTMVRGFDTESNKLILEAVRNLKDWKPGMSNGKPVKTKIILPLRMQWE